MAMSGQSETETTTLGSELAGCGLADDAGSVPSPPTSGSSATAGAPHSCDQCGKDMNPVEWIMGPVCGSCCRKNHKEVCG